MRCSNCHLPLVEVVDNVSIDRGTVTCASCGHVNVIASTKKAEVRTTTKESDTTSSTSELNSTIEKWRQEFNRRNAVTEAAQIRLDEAEAEERAYNGDDNDVCHELDDKIEKCLESLHIARTAG